MNPISPKNIELGNQLSLEQFMAIVRGHSRVAFSADYEGRVKRSRAIVEQWIREKKLMYGVNTGFGSLYTKVIDPSETEQLQHNIISCHSTSVGEPYSEEQARAVMLMVLQNLGQGYSGVRLDILERYRDFLNKGLIPWAPRYGSVGYLCPEAHIARVIEGDGKAYYQGELLPAGEVLQNIGISPLPLSAKEGLALISGTSSATALAAIALYDLIKAALSADIIGAMTMEACQGQLDAISPEICEIRPHETQAATAENMRKILRHSPMMENANGAHLQDCLSIRCIPQLHGAVKKTLYDAKRSIETEMNSCCDNPVIWPEKERNTAISACNPDSAFVGIEMDSCCIAATNLAKMSERRNSHLITGSMSGFPDFLIKNPGLNSGLMIPQYTQAGLLNEMRILSTSATIDSVPTCGGQEDYVAMGYNACLKAGAVSEKLEYILAIELLSVYETRAVEENPIERSPVTEAIFQEIGNTVPLLENDCFLHDYIEFLKNYIHEGKLTACAERFTGELR